jgi:pimeloyl-ACP methyl ester carboxylesterase
MDHLAATHRSVAPDGRGNGDTTYEPGPWSPVADLESVLDSLGLASVVLVGNSQGGRVALDAALALPGRVTGLVLVAPAVSGGPVPEMIDPATQRLSDAIDEADEAGDVVRTNRLEAHLWLDGPASPEGRVAGPARDLFLTMNGIALRADDPGPEITPEDTYARLDEIAVPTTVVVGALDLPPVVARAEALAARIPRARLLVLDDRAHLPGLEDPAQLAGIIAGTT